MPINYLDEKEGGITYLDEGTQLEAPTTADVRGEEETPALMRTKAGAAAVAQTGASVVRATGSLTDAWLGSSQFFGDKENIKVFQTFKNNSTGETIHYNPRDYPKGFMSPDTIGDWAFTGRTEDSAVVQNRTTKALRDFNAWLADGIDSTVPLSWEEAQEALRTRASAPLEGNALQKSVGFLDKGGMLLVDNLPNLAAAKINPALGMTVMFSNEKNAARESMTGAGIPEEVAEHFSSMYGMVSTPVEYAENLGRVTSAFGVNPKRTILRSMASKLKEAGLNIAEESVQKFFEDVLFNEAAKLSNEKYGTEIELRDLKAGYGETASGSAAMSLALEALGLSGKGLRRITQGKAITEAQLQEIEALDVLPDVDSSGVARAEEGVDTVTAEEVDTAPIQEISSKAQKILGVSEAVKNVFRPFVSMTTRIKEIAPRVKMALDKADQKAHKIMSANTQAIKPFANSVKEVRKQVSKDEWKIVKAEILNGDWAALEARGIKGVGDLRVMFEQTAEALGIPSIENYFRRKVKDYKGLIQHLGEKPKGQFKKAIDARAKELGRELTVAEKSTIIRNELRTKEGSGLGARRTIDQLTPEMAEFYEDPLFELENYLRQSAQTIARKEMLGIDQGVTDELGEVDPSVADDDIAKIIAEMSEEGMDIDQERELAKMLQSVLEFKRGGKHIERLNSLLRRAVSIKYVTKLKTTVKQWGDFWVNVAENGVVNVLGSTKEAKNWSNEFGKEVELSLQEQGIERLDAELQESKRKWAEEALFKPLQSQDLLNKRILMRSTAMKWRRLAKSNPVKLRQQLMYKFNDATFVDGIIKDITNQTLSEDVSFALYSQMADFHPISHNQHIRLYIEHPVLRPLFMLKSFAFKRFDRLYREGIAQTIDGLAKNRAGAADGNVNLRKEGADQLASGILGLSRFFIASVGGEMLIEKMYKEAMQALGFAPEEIPEDEGWTEMYLQELSKVAPFIDPYSLEKAVDRGDPWLYFEEAHDIPAPWGSDAVKDLIKHMNGDKEADMNKWKKDVPWFGELLWGAEQESRESKLMRERRKELKRKRRK